MLKTAIDFYRRGKNKDITGIFQFMFIDCWPSITWSVVDYFGTKKKGYFALQKAFQPLYISVNVRQKKYFAGQKLKIDYWIINDYHKTFNSCRLIISLSDEITYNIPVKDIGKDSILFSYWEDSDIILPERIKTGKYNLNFRLKLDGDVLSENDYEIEIVKKV
jgi:beta-mannosidase